MNPVTLAVDGNDPATGIESRFWITEIGGTPAIKLIDPSDAQGIGNDAIQYGAVFTIGGTLYTCLQATAPGSKATVFKSIDAGASWSALDAGSGPTRARAQCFDGLRFITVLWGNAGNTIYTFRKFDLVTETWRADFGGLSPAALKVTVSFMALRSDGTYFVMTSAGFGGPGATSMAAATFDPVALTWSATFDPGVNIAALPGYNGAVTAVSANRITYYVDSADKIGLLIQITALNGLLGGHPSFFQQLTPVNALAEFVTLPADLLNATPGGGSPFGNPILLTGIDSVVIPITRAQPVPNDGLPYMTLLIGTPISAPVFTELAGQGIDPGSRVVDGGDGTLTPESSASFATDGVNLYCSWLCADATGLVDLARVRFSQTAIADPTTGWLPSTVFDMTAGAPTFFYPSPVPPAPNAQQMFLTTLFFSGVAAPVVATPIGPYTPLGSQPLIPNVVQLPNPATICGRNRKMRKQFQQEYKPKCS